MRENEYKPNYTVSPMETLAEFCLHNVFGTDLVEEFERGITEKNVHLITAMFPKTPRQFWLNLQKNYEKTKQALFTEEATRIFKEAKPKNSCMLADRYESNLNQKLKERTR